MGESSDWKMLFEMHFEQVYSYVAFRVAPDHQTAMDIVQEVFLAARQARVQYRREASPLTWLRGIARNKVADHFRAARARAVHAQRTLTPADREYPEQPDGQAEAQAKAMLVSATLRRLSNEQASLLEEKYLDGLPIRELARRRGISEKATESALARARTAFREAHAQLCGTELAEEDPR